MITRVGDDAVRSKTGKTWDEWFSALDKAGASSRTHKEIVAILSEKFSVGPWWRQMVAVTYEQERGLRLPHEKPEGYEISISKTINSPAAVLYAHWKDSRKKSAWLKESFTVSSERPGESLRMIWENGPTRLDVRFAATPGKKCQVVVQHRKLASAAAAEQQKKFWKAALERLAEQVD